MLIMNTVATAGIIAVVVGFAGAFICARRRVMFLTARLKRLESRTAQTEARLRTLETKVTGE